MVIVATMTIIIFGFLYLNLPPTNEARLLLRALDPFLVCILLGVAKSEALSLCSRLHFLRTNYDFWHTFSSSKYQNDT